MVSDWELASRGPPGAVLKCGAVVHTELQDGSSAESGNLPWQLPTPLCAAGEGLTSPRGSVSTVGADMEHSKQPVCSTAPSALQPETGSVTVTVV